MCNILVFNKNFKSSKSKEIERYFFIIGKNCLYRDFDSDDEALAELKVLLQVNSNIKCFKSISGEDGSNERMYALTI